MKKLKDILNESILGDLPSAKLFKYNKSTGKYDAPKHITEADSSDPIKDHVQDIIQSIVDFEDRLHSEYGTKALIELNRISTPFINNLKKLATKYK